MSGMLTIIIIIFVAAVITGIISKKNNSANHNEYGVPFGAEEKYKLALNPCTDGKPLMYDLTTCRHCVRVQDFLTKNGVEYNDVLVDRFIGNARIEVVAKLKEYNPKASFPTVVFPDGTIIIGYRETLLSETITAYKKSLGK